MKLLFVKLKHIGDALILTPTLAAVRQRHPDAEIWVVTRRGNEGILAGCGAINRVLTAAPPERKNRRPGDGGRDLRLALELRRQRFDYAFELTDGDRGRWLAGMSGARVRSDYSGRVNWFWRRVFNRFSHFDWSRCHSVERDYGLVNDVLPLGGAIPPMSFERGRVEAWEPAAGLRDFVVMHPATRWNRKRWDTENWIAVGKRLLERVSHVVVSSGPDEGEMKQAMEITTALGDRAIFTGGKLSWAQLAGLLHRARLMVVVDTGALHLAAACGCPTVGLYVPASAPYWRPWKVESRVVTDLDYAPNGPRPTSENVEGQRIAPIRVDQVIAACEELLALVPRGQPRPGVFDPQISRMNADEGGF